MFGDISKAVVKQLGTKDLICNEDLIQDIKMLTLVQPKRNKLGITKYMMKDKTLLDLLEDSHFIPDVTEEVLVEDFKIQRRKGGEGSVAAGVHDAAQMKMNASMDTVDGVKEGFTLKRKTVDTNELEEMENKKIKMKMVDRFNLQKEKLTCVYQTVYTTTPLTFYSEATKSGLLSGMCSKIFHVSMARNKKKEISYKALKGATFAYGLMEIKTAGSPLRITEFNRYEKGWNISFDGDGDSCKTLEELKEEISENARLLQPLETLLESSRRNLLRALSDIVHDRDALTLLEETLDEEMTECPQSQSVSSFMDLLREASSESKQRDAVHLLVTALDSLPDGAAALLTACSPETLTVLQQLVSCLMEGGQVSLPECLPVSLQEEGELRWVAKLLCLTDQKLTELRDQWDRPEFPPEMLLELLCLVVKGLSLMQP